MVDRILKLTKTRSFFLFGARGTGKTTLLRQTFGELADPSKQTIAIDLLDPDQEEVFSRSPARLRDLVAENKDSIQRVIIDEVQKCPKLLDVVHQLTEQKKNIQFVMTGSSARKLKHGGANLLAGRAVSFHLHPFTHLEAPNGDNLLELLSWGSLPKLFEMESDLEKRRFLRAYVQVYLKQEIQLEQLVRDIVSFREFLDLAGQCNGEIINFSNIASRSGVDEKTVARYFEILVDTLVGFFLEPFDESVRARQSLKPKFYLFDLGVTRHIQQGLNSTLVPGSAEYGKAFEHFIICECFRLNDYLERDYKFSYLRTKDGVEIDLVVRLSPKKKILIEIKSTDRVIDADLKSLKSIGKDLAHKEAWVLCNETLARQTVEGIRILPWRQGLKELFEM